MGETTGRVVGFPAGKPSLPPGTQRSLAWSIRTFGGTTSLVDPQWLPPVLDEAAIDEAKAAIDALRRYLAPVTDLDWLRTRIDICLQHGFVEPGDPDAMAMLFADWIAGLRPFPRWAIAKAAAAFAGTPGPKGLGEIVGLCRLEVHEASLELEALRRLVDPEQQQAARARAAEAAAVQSRAEGRVRFNIDHPEGPLAVARAKFFQQQGGSDGTDQG